MNEAYKVGVEVELEDKVTPGLKSIIDALNNAGGKFTEFGSTMKELTEDGNSLAEKLHEASKAAEELGKGGGIAAASARFDKMATTSATIAKNMQTAVRSGENVGWTMPQGSHTKPKYHSAKASASTEGEEGGSSAAAAAMIEEGGPEGAAVAIVLKSMQMAGEAFAAGFKNNMNIDDINLRVVASSGMDRVEWPQGIIDLGNQEKEFLAHYASVSHGKPEPFAEAELVASTLLRELPPEKRRAVLGAAMPYAAFDARVRNREVPETIRPFIELADTMDMTEKEQADPLFNSMDTASNTTGVGVDVIAERAGFARTALKATGGKADDFMLLMTMMSHMNSEKGELLDNLASNPLPDKLDAKNVKANQAGEKLGLYKDNQALFYQGDKVDLMRELSLLAEARERMKGKPEEFNAALKAAFNDKGELAESLILFFRKQEEKDFEKFKGMRNIKLKPNMARDDIQTYSTAGKFDQTLANANMTLMNATVTFTGPANLVLDKASKITSSTAEFTEKNPNLLTGQISAIYSIGKTLLTANHNFMDNLFKGRLSLAPILPEKSTPPEKLLPPPPVPKARPGPVVPTPEKSRVQELLEDGSKPVDQGIHVSVYLDSKQISSYLISSTSQGPSGMNGTASLLRPGVSSLGLA